MTTYQYRDCSKADSYLEPTRRTSCTQLLRTASWSSQSGRENEIHVDREQSLSNAGAQLNNSFQYVQAMLPGGFPFSQFILIYYVPDCLGHDL